MIYFKTYKIEKKNIKVSGVNIKCFVININVEYFIYTNEFYIEIKK